MMTADERTFISEGLARGESHTDIATGLLLREALAKVESVASSIATSIETGAQIMARYYVPLRAPLDPKAKPVVLTTNADGDERVQMPQRAELHVMLSDLPAFAEAHNLNLEQIRLVADGEVQQHRGWERGRSWGRASEWGHEFKEVHDAAWAAKLGTGKKQPKIKRVYEQAPTGPEPVLWQPAPKAAPDVIYTPRDN
jgi:hypothetical protein